ncbi:hypothetical protein D3C87_1671980 [compost metagenome]
MLQYAHFGQGFTSGLAAAWWHHGEHIPTGDGGKMRETGETLERAGELLIVIVVHEVLVSESGNDKK